MKEEVAQFCQSRCRRDAPHPINPLAQEMGALSRRITRGRQSDTY